MQILRTAFAEKPDTLFAVRHFFVILPLFHHCLRIVYSGLKGADTGANQTTGRTINRATTQMFASLIWENL